MKYCSKCKRLHNDEETVCKNCKAQLKTITDENTPVYLLTASGFELQRVKAALEDSTVPCDATIKKCMENKYSKSIKAYTGYDDLTYDEEGNIIPNSYTKVINELMRPPSWV